MKKKILSLSSILILLAILGGGTLAAFTADDIAHNVITSGGVDIKLVEEKKDGSPFINNLLGIMPGDTEDKVVYIRNVGPNDAYVRVKLTTTVQAADGTALSAEPIGYVVKEGWVDGNDGYYYYKPALKPGTETPKVIEEVKFGETMNNDYQSCKVHVKIEAQAVQVANNGDNATAAQGWPKEVTE